MRNLLNIVNNYIYASYQFHNVTYVGTRWYVRYCLYFIVCKDLYLIVLLGRRKTLFLF